MIPLDRFSIRDEPDQTLSEEEQHDQLLDYSDHEYQKEKDDFGENNNVAHA